MDGTAPALQAHRQLEDTTDMGWGRRRKQQQSHPALWCAPRFWWPWARLPAKEPAIGLQHPNWSGSQTGTFLVIRVFKQQNTCPWNTPVERNTKWAQKCHFTWHFRAHQNEVNPPPSLQKSPNHSCVKAHPEEPMLPCPLLMWPHIHLPASVSATFTPTAVQQRQRSSWQLQNLWVKTDLINLQQPLAAESSCKTIHNPSRNLCF